MQSCTAHFFSDAKKLNALLSIMFMKKGEGRRIALGHWLAAAFVQLGAGLTFIA